MDLFGGDKKEGQSAQEKESVGKGLRTPLAVKMRPGNFDEVVGQNHLLAPGKLFRKTIEAELMQSFILYGPPSSGKTTMAGIVAGYWSARFVTMNAVLDGVKELRNVVQQAEEYRKMNRQTVLFVDEIHRWNRAQQDALLPHVENGVLTLIGATTENPFYSLVGPLLSRCQLFELFPPTQEEVGEVIDRAILDKERGLGAFGIVIEPEARLYIASACSGDIRLALSALESSVFACEPDETGAIHLSEEHVKQAMSARHVRFDKTGDEHYHYASAFIKSMRGSDPDGALYWLSAMLTSGEDPEFVFRRLLIFCSEDIGMADSQALQTVVAAHQSFVRVGMPESWYFLAHACIYCSLAPKSNSTSAIFDVRAYQEKNGIATVPDHLKDKTASALKAKFTGTQNFADDYKYPHSYPNHWVSQNYVPSSISESWYKPGEEGAESRFNQRLQQIKNQKKT